MALTVTNTNTILLLNILNRHNAAQQNTLTQLTTGKRINAGKDDPAGLIALSSLNAELTAVNASLTNNQRTDAMLGVADASFGEIATLLSEIETLVVASTSDANLTASEVAANQSQIDDALTAIDRIVNTTNFNGKKLLDGTFSIVTPATNFDNVAFYPGNTYGWQLEYRKHGLELFDPRDQGGQELVAKGLDGREAKAILRGALGVHGTLSVDRRRLITDVYDWPEAGRAAILRYNLTTGDYEVLVRMALPDTTHKTGCHPHPVFSRDRKRVYFNSTNSGVPRLYAIEL